MSKMEKTIPADKKAAHAAEEQYKSRVSRGIAAVSGMITMVILCCGDFAVAILKWICTLFPKHNNLNHSNVEHRGVSSRLPTRIHRVNNITKKLEEIAIELLSRVVKLTQYIASSIVNSKVGKKLTNLLPREITLATLDAFDKIWNALEVTRKNVLSTLSGATTQLVSERYGENAGKATDEGLEAVAHTVGAATTISNIPNAARPENAVRPSSLANSAKSSSNTQFKKET